MDKKKVTEVKKTVKLPKSTKRMLALVSDKNYRDDIRNMFVVAEKEFIEKKEQMYRQSPKIFD